MRYLAPPQFAIDLTDAAPHLLTYCAAGPGGGLTPAGVTAVNSQVTTYLTVTKLAALARESQRYQGPPTVPAAIVTATTGSWPVAAADIATQVAALQAVIASNAT